MPITVFDAVGKFSADTRNLDEFVTKLDQALPDASQKSAVATKALKDAQDNLRTSLKALKQEGGDTAENWKKVADAQRQVAITSAATRQAQFQLRESIGAVKESSKEARGELGLLGELFGVSLPRHVRSFIADVPRIQGLLKGAFAATAIYFFVQALGEGVLKIEDVISALAGWDEAAKKTYADQVKLNQTFIDLANQQAEAKVREKERGLEGASLTRQQIEDNKIILGQIADRLTKLNLQKQATDNQLRSEKSLASATEAWAKGSTFIQERKDKIEQLSATSKSIDEQILAAIKERATLLNQDGDKQSQLLHQSLSEYIAVESAKTEAKRANANAQITLDLAVWRNEVSAGIISNQQLLALEQKANEDKYQNDLAAQQRRLELLQKDPSRNLAAIQTLQGQIVAMEREHNAQLIDSDTEYSEEKKRLDALRTDPRMVNELTAFDSQIEAAEASHNAKMLKITLDGISAIAAAKAKLQGQIDKNEFSQPIKETITLNFNDQKLLDAVNILGRLGDQTATSAKRAGEAQAAYDELVAAISGGDTQALGSQKLLNDSMDDFKGRLEAVGNNTQLLLGLRDVIQQEIEATDEWGGSTTVLEDKLAAVEKRLSGIGIIVDNVGKRAQHALSPVAAIFKQVITGSITAGAAAKQFGMITAEGIGMSVAAAVDGSESFGQAMQRFLKSTLSTLAGEAIVQAIVELAKGFAALSPTSPDFGHAGEHFASAAIWGSVGAAAAAVGSAIPSGGGGGGNETAGAPKGTGPIETTPVSETQSTPRQTTQIQRFAAGGLVSGPTLAIIGDAMGSASSAIAGAGQREAAIPIDDDRATGAIALALAKHLPRETPIVHVHGKSLRHLIREISHEVENGGVQLTASRARSVRKKS
jgi:hypothetical protein